MKIEVVNNNVILVNPSKENFEIHPLWLRERAKTNELVDKISDTLGWCIKKIDYTSNLIHPLTSYL